jgi:hypothetical protein
MKFWKVKVFNCDLKRYKAFGICGDDTDSFRSIKKILELVHPEYKDIKVRKCKKPKTW